MATVSATQECIDRPSDITDTRQVIDVFLGPGDYYFGDADTRISTVLGSCVAVTVWQPELQIGGMCHFMLPTRGSRTNVPPAPDGRYGDEAIAMLVRDMRARRTSPRDYEVKVFGGGNMFPAQTRPNSNPVGDRNVEFALAAMKKAGLAVAARHVAGVGHRQIVFEVWSGAAWVRHNPLSMNQE